jgi:plasmid stabilization system protein ParE
LRYRVEITRTAHHDIGNIYAWMKEHTPGSADRWLVGLYEAIDSLAEMPLRCPLAPEAAEAGGEPRQLLFRSWRVIYEISGRRVQVHRIRHTSL